MIFGGGAGRYGNGSVICTEDIGRQAEDSNGSVEAPGSHRDAGDAASTSGTASMTCVAGEVASRGTGRGGQRRATLCISSQVGCAMGCTFCSTGTMGLLGDLTAGEIVEQMVHARSVMTIRNVVFMGMGEPLNNYEPVRSAVLMMTDPR